jgi:DNA repair exonuclease SbcCD ATPase subunit
MLGNLDERLTQAKTQLRVKQKFESMLRQAQNVVRDERSKSSNLKEKLADEKADVDKLEKLSLTGLFYSVLGTKDERLEQERQEFLAAKLKHEEAVKSLEDAQREVNRLSDELTPLADAGADYDRLIVEKEKLLAEAGDDNAKKLLDMSEQLADLNSDRKELQEAIAAGQTTLNSLRQVSSELGSAANWGTWDMFGGGMISTMAKHSKIDSAKQHAHQAQRQLRRFQEELADADHRLHVSLEIGGFSKFADFFFDGLIADWVVQSKISEASSACSSTMNRVSSAINECRRRLAETEQDIKKLTSSKQEFIESA